MLRSIFRAFSAVLTLAVVASAAQVADHLKCYKISDPLNLSGVVDLNSPQFGPEAGCTISRAKLFCVPASKAVVAAKDRVTGAPIIPQPFSGPPSAADRVCYKVRCPRPSPPDTQVTDQFGTRTLSRFRASMVCTPAVKGPTYSFPGTFPASGQTTAYTADKNDGIAGPVAVPDDGTVRAGAVLRYMDNGDGTITDLNTGLMWEKKGDDGSLHDKDNLYRWSGDGSQETIWDWLDDVKAEGGTGFAGYNDWRIPNAKELQSIVNYERLGPAADPVFNSGCASGCTVLTCSCTGQTQLHWSSTKQAGSGPGPSTSFWSVGFQYGNVFAVSIGGNDGEVRAVRGGL